MSVLNLYIYSIHIFFVVGGSCGHTSSFLMGKYLGVGLLGCMVSDFNFMKTTKLFFKVVNLFSLLSNETVS